MNSSFENTDTSNTDLFAVLAPIPPIIKIMDDLLLTGFSRTQFSDTQSLKCHIFSSLLLVTAMYNKVTIIENGFRYEWKSLPVILYIFYSPIYPNI